MAVEELSLEVDEGEIFGFLGPNGAGKTTAIRILCTLLRPDCGDARVSGQSIRVAPRRVRQSIGYMPDFFGVYSDTKVWEYLDFFCACYRLPERDRPDLIRDLLELVDLSHRADDMVDQLSRGMKQRLSLARTLIHDPAVLILDEPASGLDPRARVEIRELMKELARMGKTIFFSTHILADVSEICTRVGIIEAGKLLAVGKEADLHAHLLTERRLHLTILGNPDGTQELLESHPGVVNVQRGEISQWAERVDFIISFSGEDVAVSGILARLAAAEVPVVHFSEQRQDLEDIFMQITKGLVT